MGNLNKETCIYVLNFIECLVVNPYGCTRKKQQNNAYSFHEGFPITYETEYFMNVREAEDSARYFMIQIF